MASSSKTHLWPTYGHLEEYYRWRASPRRPAGVVLHRLPALRLRKKDENFIVAYRGVEIVTISPDEEAVLNTDGVPTRRAAVWIPHFAFTWNYGNAPTTQHRAAEDLGVENRWQYKTRFSGDYFTGRLGTIGGGGWGHTTKLRFHLILHILGVRLCVPFWDGIRVSRITGAVLNLGECPSWVRWDDERLGNPVLWKKITAGRRKMHEHS